MLSISDSTASEIIAEPPCDGVRCGKCVKWSKVMDGVPDCWNHRDETITSSNLMYSGDQDNSSFYLLQANTPLV